jgi:hypothetical protein
MVFLLNSLVHVNIVNNQVQHASPSQASEN